MTVRVTKPAVNLREKITELESNNADEARIGSLVTDSIDAVAIDAESLSVGGWASGNPNYNDIVINSPNNGGLTIFTNSPTAYGGVVFHDDNTQTSTNRNSYAGGIYYQHTGNAMEFHTNTQERARIDSSGNLLIGQSTTVSPGVGNTTVGSAVDADGNACFSRSASTALFLNRNTSDGDIAQFRKDGTTVGSIGTISSNDLYISDGRDSGLKFDGGNDEIIPCTSAGAANDATQDLGASAARFKDLYLSGGVYLGGTGATNLLDDYEEGTFTPTVVGTTGSGTASYTTNAGYYTKIGRMVHVSIRIDYSGGTGTGDLKINGLPFQANGSSDYRALGVAGNNGITTSAGTLAAPLITNAFSSILMYEYPTGGGAPSPVAYDAAGILNLTVSYQTA